LLAGLLSTPIVAQNELSDLPPARLSAPFADPLVDFDASVTAQRVTSWTDGDAPMLRLENDAVFRVGAYGFRADGGVVRVEFEDTDAGRVKHLAAYLVNARPLAGVGAINAEGGRLLVTASTTGGLKVDSPGSFEAVNTPPSDGLILEAKQRLARHRGQVEGPGLIVPDTGGLPPEEMIRRQRRRAQIAEAQRQLIDAPPGEALAAVPLEGEARDDAGRPSSILPARGVLAYSMDAWSAQFGDDETTVSLTGDVRLVFEDHQQDRVVTLRAQQVVLFVANDDDGQPPTDAFGRGSIDAGNLRGVYLEDNAIVSDGQYTVRAPRMYYDLARNRATLLDAVFYTYDARRKIPLYVRAASVRQTSASDFTATDAKLTTSEFAVPHFSIGAGELTLRQYRTADGEVGQIFEARDSTLNLGQVPVFYWPYLSAYGRDTPLRSVNAGYSSRRGVDIETNWDLFALLGRPAPDDTSARLDLDYLGEHGPGVGVSGRYNRRDSLGSFRGYYLADDSGEDDVGGRVINQEDQQRGVALVRHRTYLPANYEVSLEGAYVSDPTFLEEFYPDDAASAKNYETSAYVKWAEGSQAVDALAVTDLSNFLEQLDALQSHGYSVDRYPEVTHRLIGGELLPGLTWFSQTTFSQLRLVGGDDAPEDRGFNDAQAQRFFGINADVSFEDRLDQLGLPDFSVRRLDTRQELSLPMRSGPIDVTPYVVGRVTAYDEDFAGFNGGNDDQVRLWGEAGLRLGTEFSRADGSVRSRLFDVDGLRHLVAPSATLFLNGATLDPDDLPVYDPTVESLAEGAGIRLGVTNTWQTRRGGPGRQRTVDWITWRTDLVLRSDDADVETLLPRFYDYRPELARGGDHLSTELRWLVTDTLGLAGELTHSLESDRVAQWRLGSTLDHTPRLTSFLAYEAIDPLDSQLLSYGFNYRLTTKYRLGFRQTLDFADDDSRQIELLVDRKLPRWTMRVKVGFDEIDDESRISISLIPDGRSDDVDLAFN
jgi:hypothetical protein